MADITKCNSETCRLKQKCYRYTAPASEGQKYEDYGADSGWWGCRMILTDPVEWIKFGKELENERQRIFDLVAHKA